MGSVSLSLRDPAPTPYPRQSTLRPDSLSPSTLRVGTESREVSVSRVCPVAVGEGRPQT